MRRLAITGGRGRLAPLVARFFEDAGCEVQRFSRRADGGFQALERLGDPAVFSTYDAVIHAAWSTVPFTAEQNPGAAEVHDLPLLRTLLRAGSGGHTRLVFLSTGAVYGDTGETPATESMMPAPLGHYARAKLAAERLVEEGPVPAAILRITGHEELLQNSPVIRKSIALRNPYTDVLNLLQIELIRRSREAEEGDVDELRHDIFLSINGIAAAMQTTG